MEDLKKYCEEQKADFNACEVLLKYYKKIGWSKEKAVKHIKCLIENGVIDEIKSFAK